MNCKESTNISIYLAKDKLNKLELYKRKLEDELNMRLSRSVVIVKLLSSELDKVKDLS